MVSIYHRSPRAWRAGAGPLSRLAGLAVLLAAGPALAQESPSFDCGQAESTTEKLICDDPDLAALDRQVAERFSTAIDVTKNLDAGADQAEADLRAYQRGWIKGRDECWKAEDLRACVKQEYQRREAELVTLYMLEQPTSTAVWQCGGSPANEVVTMFFDTALPSLRFERGDSIDTGTLAPAGSGSKYEGSFGRSIWISGEEATYREPDPDGTEYACVLAK